MENYIQNLAVQLLPKHKKTPSGWVNFNCPACIHRGQPRPDSRFRGGMELLPNGGIKYHCFNCKLKASWNPGFLISKNVRNMFKWLGASDQEINKANFEALKIKEQGDFERDFKNSKTANLDSIKLPYGSKKISEWTVQKNIPEKFLQALEYIDSRNTNLLEWYDDFYWSESDPDRIIFPLIYNRSIYGYTARLTRDPKTKNEPKYLGNNQAKFLFNADKLFVDSRKYVIITEGPLDAIAIDGVSVLGTEISDLQERWINSSNKQVIVIPDRDHTGKQLVKEAKNRNWAVSFPPFDKSVVDPLDAVEIYGRLLTIKMIIENMEQNHLKIDIKAKEWF